MVSGRTRRHSEKVEEERSLLHATAIPSLASTGSHVQSNSLANRSPRHLRDKTATLGKHQRRNKLLRNHWQLQPAAATDHCTACSKDPLERWH